MANEQISINTIKFSEESLDQAANYLGERSAKILKEKGFDLDPKMAQLKIAASNFIKTCNTAQIELIAAIQRYNEQNNLLTQVNASKRGSDEKVNAAEMLDNFHSNQDYININTQFQKLGAIMYQASFTFQGVIDEILDRKIKLTLVYRNKIYIIDSKEYAQYLKYEEHRGNIVARFTNLNNIRNQMNAALYETSDYYKQRDTKNVIWAKNSATWRYNRSHQVLGLKGKGLVLWHSHKNSSPALNGWTGMWVPALGDINEGYAAILLKHEQDQFMGLTNINNILDIFMFSYVQQVDNESALAHGDVVIEQSKVQYAIKSSQASAEGLQQIANLASRILADDFISVNQLQEEVKTKIKQDPEARHRLLKDPIQELTNEQLEQLGLLKEKIDIKYKFAV